MSKPIERPAAPFKVDDPAEAFQRFKDFTRQILAVPKKEIDRKLAAEQAAKKKRKPR